MKKILSVVFFMMFVSLYSQTTVLTDNNGDGIIEYQLVSKEGTTLEEGFYYNGKMFGTWRLYTTEGNLQMVARFKDGLKHGRWIIYDEKGRVKTEVVYNNGYRQSASEHRYN